MPRTVRIQGDSAVFPGDACVHCLHPMAGKVEVLKVKRGTVRRVGVPFCEECTALREHRSPAQIQFERGAAVLSFLLAWGAGVWTYTYVSAWNVLHVDQMLVWSVLLGVLVVAIVFGALYLIVRPWAKLFRSAETKASLAAVTIRDFDWETTTLEFASDEYAERFERVNQVAAAASPPGEDGA
jgi:hypothetical protein